MVEQLAIELGRATYHAHSEDREGTLARLISGELSIITATTALGFGTDIPDIKLVMHVQTPWTFLDYAQEGPVGLLLSRLRGFLFDSNWTRTAEVDSSKFDDIFYRANRFRASAEGDVKVL
jgi:Helicase conserved C-terminal domain